MKTEEELKAYVTYLETKMLAAAQQSVHEMQAELAAIGPALRDRIR